MPHKSVSQIAVFVDPMSFYHMKDQTHITVDCVGANRDSLNECGAPYDYFNQKDLPFINHDQYKMYVFLNALEITDEVKDYIKTHLPDKTVVWLHAPNLFSGGIDEVCSIRLSEINDPTAKMGCGNETFGFTDPVAPLFAVEDAEVLAAYTDKTPACAQKGNQVYLAVGNVPSSLWRDIARRVGVIFIPKRPVNST